MILINEWIVSDQVRWHLLYYAGPIYWLPMSSVLVHSLGRPKLVHTIHASYFCTQIVRGNASHLANSDIKFNLFIFNWLNSFTFLYVLKAFIASPIFTICIRIAPWHRVENKHTLMFNFFLIGSVFLLTQNHWKLLKISNSWMNTLNEYHQLSDLSWQ